jgi:probable HAF family extracellular repeat protein
MHTLLHHLAAASLLLSMGSASALEYQLTDLGELKADFKGSAHGINRQGEVVGASQRDVTDKAQARLYRQGRSIDLARRAQVQPVQGGFAHAINDHSEITGYVQLLGEAEGTPFVERHGTLTLLTHGADSHGTGYGINAGGDVVGQTRALGNGLLNGFLYHQGHLTALQGPRGQLLSSAGLAINDRGLTAGWTEVWIHRQTRHRAAVWRNGVLLRQPGLGGVSSEARAVSADGSVAGFATTPDGATHAFRFQNGQTVDLNGAGFLSSLALGINPAGTQIVGAGSTPGLKRSGGIVVIHGAMHLLDKHLAPDQQALWHVDAAWAVNDAGQIAGVATLQQGQQHAVLLTPVAPVRPQ